MTTKTSAQGSGEFVLENLTVTSVDFTDNVAFDTGATPSATGVIVGCDTIAASDFKALFKVKPRPSAKFCSTLFFGSAGNFLASPPGIFPLHPVRTNVINPKNDTIFNVLRP